MPTNVIPFAGIPAPRSIHQDLAPLSQCRNGTTGDSCQSCAAGSTPCFPFEIVVGPSAEGRGECAGANDGPITLWENQRQPTAKRATVQSSCRSAYRLPPRGCKRRVRLATLCN